MHDPNQGMDAHPIFQDEAAWAEHRHQSHGGPKPKTPAPAPEKRPENVPALPPPPEEVDELEARIVTLEAQIGGQAAINETLQARLADLEIAVNALETKPSA